MPRACAGDALTRCRRFGPVAVILAVIAVVGVAPAMEAPTAAELRLCLTLARVCEAAYDDETQPGFESTPSGCVALVREDGDGNLIIAFRGSMLGDRTPSHPFSSFGGETVRRNYRDWVATNLKQLTGFLPRQYSEAAELVERYARSHPAGKRVYVTGHSKGGGAATYAYVAAMTSDRVTPGQAERLRCVTFNAAVVRERNWRRLFRRRDRVAPSRPEPAAGSVLAVCMRDDPVSRLSAAEERAYVRRLVIAPATDLAANRQHGLDAVIPALSRLIQNVNATDMPKR